MVVMVDHDEDNSKGLEIFHVTSDEKHYGEFICVVCLNVAALDAVVATRCSHAFCIDCLQSWVSQRGGPPHRCPACSADLVEHDPTKRSCSMNVNGARIAAQPMSEGQPLAYRVFGRIQIRCPHRKKHHCSWEGDYNALRGHLANHSGNASRSSLDLDSHSGSGSASRFSGSQSSSPPQPTKPRRRHRRGASEGVPRQKSVRKMEIPFEGSGRRIDGIPETILGKTPDATDGGKGSGKVSSAIEDARKQGALLKEKANTEFTAGRYKKAQDLYSQAIAVMCEARATEPADCEVVATLFSNRGASWLRLKEYQNCSNDCTSAIRLNPHFTKAYLRNSRALIELGRLEDACRTLEEALLKNPDAENVKDDLRKIEDLTDRVHKADRLMNKDEYHAARDTLSALPNEYSENTRVMSTMAQIELGIGNVEKAKELARAVLKGNPRNVEAISVRGRAAFLDGDFSAAVRYIKDALRYDPDNSSAKDLLKVCRQVEDLVKTARECLLGGCFQEAAAKYAKALQASLPLPTPTKLFGILHTGMGEVYFSLGKYDAALTETKLAISARQECEIAWITRIMVYEAMEAYGELIDELGPLLGTPWGKKNGFVAAAYDKAVYDLKKKNRIDFYSLLEIRPDASEEEVRRQYKLKAFQFHPDRYVGFRHSKEEKDAAEERFKQIGEAVEILCDSFQRKLYDEGYDLDEIREKVDDKNFERRRAAQRQRKAAKA
jgi:DnaJ family protein C protein 7